MLPYHLDRVTISSGLIIDSIEFSYTDRNGQYHTTGPWGGHGGDINSVSVNHKVKFAFVEFMAIVLNLEDYVSINASMHMQRTRDKQLAYTTTPNIVLAEL